MEERERGREREGERERIFHVGKKGRERKRKKDRQIYKEYKKSTIVFFYSLSGK